MGERWDKMAVVARETWRISSSWRDDDGAVSRYEQNVVEPGVLDVGYPVIALYAAELIEAAQALSDAALLGYSISKDFYESDPVETIGEAGSDVEDKGVFLMSTNTGFKGSVSIPSILESKLVATGVETGIAIDMADADVLAFMTLLTTDVDTTPFGLAGEVHATDYRGDEFGVVTAAYKQNRASFKSRGRRG